MQPQFMHELLYNPQNTGTTEASLKTSRCFQYSDIQVKLRYASIYIEPNLDMWVSYVNQWGLVQQLLAFLE